ncbi:hypothetical protein GUJ93_ZPchr0004g39626 [Zizania palustris]|uniref:DUF4005 domain-containing protein n=1 Tax=Zizania palustris TaxID=103762 RepID=A0A8J5SLB3_ZIZPA|nr:hypothetical protein GUJ93_ZPchr0004g39626 [Zizania palustris]
MTKPKNGCLKILACAGAGSDPSAGSDAEADENKAVSDKSRWSFRRRSTRHRVLKNSDISEPETLSSSKAKAENAPSNVYSSTYPYDAEKPLHQEKPDEKILQQEKSDEKIVQQEKSDEKILHQEKLDEKIVQQENPDEKSLHEEMPDEKSTEKPIEQPDDKPIENLAVQITEKLIEQPAEKITEVPSQEPAERITENPIVEPNEKDVEELTEKPDQSIFISSTEVKQEETVSVFDRSSAEHQEDQVEPAAVVIQSDIRTYIAQQELSNHKDLVRLQAVIRGHLVRRQAAESLHCLLAIVKIQGLVRAHQVHKYGGKLQDTLIPSSSEKLLHNGFTLKLMDSMSTSKSIPIKCDPSESDGTWKWMERWTTMIPPNTGVRLLENRESGEFVDEEVIEDAKHEEKTVPLDSYISFPKLVRDDVEETLRTSDSCSLEASACIPDRTLMETEDEPEPEPVLIEKFNEDAEKLTTPKAENVVEKALEVSVEQSTQTDTSREPIPLLEKPESSYEDTMDAYTNEQTLEMEGKRFLTRKSCNPAFAAAQMKFEELTSNLTVSRSNSSSYLDGASKSKVHTPHSQDNASPKQNSDTSIPDSSVGHDPKIVLAASECGTEISISSTLDSPDRSEADGGEIVLEIGALEDRNHVADNADKNMCVLHSEANTAGEVVEPEKEEEQNDNIANPVGVIDPVPVEQPHVGHDKLDLHDQLEKSIESYAKSPECTPMSRTTFAESHGTPSSEVSVNTSKSKRPKSHVSKRSLASPSNDSVGRSSTDNLSKDYKLARRESSGKSAKSDHVNQEPRMSNSTPLPSYMQFTESARAKASASISPKLSPDVQDNNPRKRHSLPMTNGKQDSSPRMQRSSSQAQQNVKNNVAVPHNSSDRRWHI